MEAIKVHNDQGLELTVVDDDTANFQPIMGGDSSNPTWEEYVSGFNEPFQPHINLIRKAIEELGWVGECAEERANDWCFVFSDGQAVGFSWRAWGDLMQAIIGKREGYMTYYMNRK
jgi:hypothetical protein